MLTYFSTQISSSNNNTRRFLSQEAKKTKRRGPKGGDEWRRWWRKGYRGQRRSLWKNKTTAWLTEGRWHNRRPSNWWRSITERNVQVEWFNMSWQTKREEERRQADQKQDRYSTGMLSTLYPFSFYKRLHVEASCLYSIISTLRRRGSLWAQVSWALHLTTLAVQYTRFIHTAPRQSVCCSYSPQHRNVLLQEWSKQRQESVCLCKFVCVRVEETKHTLYQRESVYTINTPLHVTTTRVS